MREIYYVIDTEPSDLYYIDNPEGETYPTITFVERGYWEANGCINTDVDELQGIIEIFKQAGCYYANTVTLILADVDFARMEDLFNDNDYSLIPSEAVAEYYLRYGKEPDVLDFSDIDLLALDVDDLM